MIASRIYSNVYFMQKTLQSFKHHCSYNNPIEWLSAPSFVIDRNPSQTTQPVRASSELNLQSSNSRTRRNPHISAPYENPSPSDEACWMCSNLFNRFHSPYHVACLVFIPFAQSSHGNSLPRLVHKFKHKIHTLNRNHLESTESPPNWLTQEAL
jgi:hypothetical protein